MEKTVQQRIMSSKKHLRRLISLSQFGKTFNRNYPDFYPHKFCLINPGSSVVQATADDGALGTAENQ